MCKEKYERPSRSFPRVPRAGRMVRPLSTAKRSSPKRSYFGSFAPDGRPSVKIATTQQGSGIDLSGGIDPTYIVLTTEDGDDSLTVTDKDGRHQVIKAVTLFGS